MKPSLRVFYEADSEISRPPRRRIGDGEHEGNGVCHSRGLDWVGAAGNECQYSIAGNHSQCSSSPFTILSGAVASDAQTDGSGGWTRAGVGQIEK